MLSKRDIGLFVLAVAFVAGVLAAPIEGQTRRRKSPVKKPPVVATAPTPSPSPVEPVAKPEPKKNERPAADKPVSDPANTAQQQNNATAYYYEFTQPEFMISKIVIEHDAVGKGSITFTKKMFGDTVTDPLQVSPAAIERINAAYSALNFLDSNENYQYEKDYSHLGVSTFKFKKSGKQRTAAFNYTTNKDARVLADEYRRLGNQFIWVFDITVSRENQPLESPKLLDSLDALMRRNEISDPAQMVPLLKDLKDDERIPLIARNHAGKLVVKIEKSQKK